MIYIFIEIIILLSVNVNEYVYPGLKNGNHAKYTVYFKWNSWCTQHA